MMNALHTRPKAAIAAVALSFFVATGVYAQAQKAARSDKPADYKPEVGQAGKDVIWVPTPDEVVAKMLDFAKVTAKDYVVDLGSGDGRTVIAAAKRGARALGIEYNPNMVDLSRKNAAAAGVTARAEFRRADIFKTDFTRATVITLYLLPDLNLKLRPQLLDMPPGTRISSHQFNMGEWEPDEQATLDGRSVYHWVVPAKVAGNWNVSGAGPAFDMTLQQSFQRLSGSVRIDGRPAEVKDGRLRGSTISFSIAGDNGQKRDYSGIVSGRNIEGTVKPGDARWTAMMK